MKRRGLCGRGVYAGPKFCGFLARVPRHTMGSQVLAGSGGAVARTNASFYFGLRTVNKPQQTSLLSVVQDLVSGAKERAVKPVGGVSRNRVNRSTLSIVGGLLAFSGFNIVLCRRVTNSFFLWKCTSNKNTLEFSVKFVVNMNQKLKSRAKSKVDRQTLEDRNRRKSLAQCNWKSNKGKKSERK